jgi:hypothetical protein
MNTTILEILVKIKLIASFVGPIFLIWRFRLMGWLFGIFWFWLFLFLSEYLNCGLDVEIHRLQPQGRCAEIRYRLANAPNALAHAEMNFDAHRENPL